MWTRNALQEFISAKMAGIILCPVVNDPIGRVEDRYIR
jgi:hypothetical protein